MGGSGGGLVGVGELQDRLRGECRVDLVGSEGEGQLEGSLDGDLAVAEVCGCEPLRVRAGLDVVVQPQDGADFVVGELTPLRAERLAHLAEEGGAIDALDPATSLGTLVVVEDPEVRRDPGVVEHVGRQRDDRLEQVVLEQVPPDL